MDKKTENMWLIVIAAVAAISSVLVVLLAVLFWVIAYAHKPAGDSDKRSPEQRMAELYGETFTLTDTVRRGDYNDITISTMQDSAGNECHAAYGRDYDGGASVYRTYDDYRAVQQMQTPAVQRLLHQTDFTVRFESELGRDTAFNENRPGCRWVIEIDRYDDIPAALQLALDTVTAEDSLLPPLVQKRSEYWYSIAPAVVLHSSYFEPFEFGDTENMRKYDYQKELYTAQQRFCEWCRRNHREELLPEEAVEAHPENGIYEIRCGDETLELLLTWNPQEKCFVLEDGEIPADPDYPDNPKLLALLTACGFDLQKDEDAFSYRYVTNYKNDVIYLSRSKSTHLSSVDAVRGCITGDSASLRLTEYQLADLFGITLSIDRSHKTGTVYMLR